MSNVRTTGKKTSNTLVRDLVNVGIFVALYIVLGFMSSSIGYIPALIVFSTASIALVTSVPMFLFYSKIERPILCCMLFCGIFGGAMLVMGQSVIMFAISLAVGLLSGTILKIIGKNFAGLYMANIVLSLMSSSMMLPLWLYTEEYLEYTRGMCDEGYVAKLAELSNSIWPLVGIYTFGILGAVIGGLVARRIMKRHFERIGLAR